MINISDYKKGLLDFHTHSTYSDGGDTPTQLVRRAKEQGVSAMALTDHNVVGGLEEFSVACREAGILGIPFGTEIYAELPEEVLVEGDNEAPDLIILGKNPNKDVFGQYHQVLGKWQKEFWYPEHIRRIKEYGFGLPADFDETAEPEELKDFRVPKIVHHFVEYGKNPERLFELLRDWGAELNDQCITLEEVQGQPIRYLNRFFYSIGSPGYIRRLGGGFGLEKALQLVDAMNCKLFIAHPGGEYGFLSDKILGHYVENGVHGIEIRSYFNTPEQNAKFDRIASEHNLIRSGGSDCHGDNGPFKIGIHDRPQNQVPKEVLEELWDSLPD